MSDHYELIELITGTAALRSFGSSRRARSEQNRSPSIARRHGVAPTFSMTAALDGEEGAVPVGWDELMVGTSDGRLLAS